MNFITNINRVSEFFFLLIGTGYLIAFLSWRNNYYPFETEIFLRLADLPLAFFGVLYGVTSMRLSLTLLKNKEEEEDLDAMEDYHQKKSKFPVLDTMLLLLAIALFASIAYVDIFLPNTFPFPKSL